MDIRRRKEIGVAVFLVLFTVLEFFTLGTLLAEASTGQWYLFLLVGLSLIWLAFMSAGLALTAQPALTVLMVIPALTLAAVGRGSPVAIGGAFLLALFTLIAQRSFAREVQNRVLYRTSQVFNLGVRQLLLGLMVAVTSLALPLITTSLQGSRLQVTERHVEPLLGVVEPLIAGWLPGYTTTATVDQMIQVSLNETLTQLPAGLTIDEGETARQRAAIGRSLSVELTGRETMPRIVAAMINGYVGQIAAQNPLTVSLILVVVVFLTLRTLVPFLVWPVIGVIAGIVWMARQIGLIYITRSQAMVERLQL